MKRINIPFGLKSALKRTIAPVFLTLISLSAACVSHPSKNLVSYSVVSDPLGCVVEVDGFRKGVTPLTIQLGVSKHWVGLMYAPGGWEYGPESYTIMCLPPSDSTGALTSQTKIVRPSESPSGGELFFNLRLRPVSPTHKIEIQQDVSSDVNIRADQSERSPAVRIRELKNLHSEGLISDDEFEAKRMEILQSM